MKNDSLSHVPDHALIPNPASLVARERATLAKLLAYLAEADARRLYLPHGQPSMYDYCVNVLRLSEEDALERITVAREARKYPAIFEAVADGRLNLNTIVLLTSHLTSETVDELLAAAANKSNSEVETLLAERFPKSDPPAS